MEKRRFVKLKRTLTLALNLNKEGKLERSSQIAAEMVRLGIASRFTTIRHGFSPVQKASNIVHQVTQLLWGHFFRKDSVDTCEQTSTVNHLSAALISTIISVRVLIEQI